MWEGGNAKRTAEYADNNYKVCNKCQVCVMLLSQSLVQDIG